MTATTDSHDVERATVSRAPDTLPVGIRRYNAAEAPRVESGPREDRGDQPGTGASALTRACALAATVSGLSPGL